MAIEKVDVTIKKKILAFLAEFDWAYFPWIFLFGDISDAFVWRWPGKI
jgi:hypothetical protein